MMRIFVLIVTFVLGLPVSYGFSAEMSELYSCKLAGTSATYTRAEIDTVISAGGKCSPLGAGQITICTIGNIAQRYANDEVETVLQEQPDAVCVRDGVLVVKVSSIIVGEKRVLDTRLRVYFGHDSDVLDSIDDVLIARFAHRFASSGAWMTITAYTDKSGSQAYNHALSVRRAKKVRQRLQYYGVSADEIIAVSAMGETAPPVPTGDGKRKSSNRVVIVRVYQ